MKNLVSIVITTHGKGRDLPCILSSLELQRTHLQGTHSRDRHPVQWVMGDYLDKRDYPYEVIVTCDGPYTGPALNVDRVIENEAKGAPGHHTRAPGIEAATGDWIVLTNSDNYFMSGWRSLLDEHLSKPYTGMMYWQGVNNLWNYTTRASQGGVQLKRGFIDLSFVCVRAEIAKEVGFPFTTYDGDWEYIDDCCLHCIGTGKDVIKMPEILSVHN